MDHAALQRNLAAPDRIVAGVSVDGYVAFVSCQDVSDAISLAGGGEFKERDLVSVLCCAGIAEYVAFIRVKIIFTILDEITFTNFPDLILLSFTVFFFIYMNL